MKTTLLGHTQLSKGFLNELVEAECAVLANSVPAGQIIALTAIRTCYSPLKPSQIFIEEGEKYFNGKPKDGGSGSDADRLVRQIIHSKHTSTLEHVSFVYAVEGVSRALLAQLTRHRVGFGFSVQSQRYVKFSSDSKSGGFEFVTPERVIESEQDVEDYFNEVMESLQVAYDTLIKMGVPQEDARAVLPNCATCNLTLSINLRALLDFYAKRQAGKGAQKEITQLAEELKAGAIEVEPWIESFFGGAK